MGNFDSKKLPGKLKDTFLFLEKELINIKPNILITLGSGQGEVLKNLNIVAEIPFNKIPGIPKSSVSGHKGFLEIAKHQNNFIAIMRGRLHTYETHCTLDDVVRIQKTLALLGLEKAILTNASGSTSLEYIPGSLVLITDHINFTGLSPLISDELLAYYFMDQSKPYDAELSDKILSVSINNSIKMKKGTYAWMRGPQYETPSETKMLNILGANIVGMSTVPEVIIFNYFKVKVAGISVVTNYAGGIVKDKVLTHEEVKETANGASKNLSNILEATINLI